MARELDRGVDDRGHVGRLDALLGRARVGAQVVDEAADAVRAVERVVERARAVDQRVAARHGPDRGARDLDVGDHVGQRVVDLVGHAGGQRAERGHPLGDRELAVGLAELAGPPRDLALELAPHRIRVCGVAPGMVDTDSLREWLDDTKINARGRKLPAGRIGLPDDLGKVVLMMASDLGAWIYGATLVADGGELLGEVHHPPA